MACLTLKTLILISIKLVGVLGWMKDRRIGASIVKKALAGPHARRYLT